MAVALKHAGCQGKSKIVSMEDIYDWYEKQLNAFPDNLKEYVEFIHSPKREYFHSIFRGVGYSNIPDYNYDLVFIDGPGTMSPVDRQRTFDFDYINIVSKSRHPVLGVIDNRKGTCFVFQKVFGKKFVRFNKILNLGFVGPCSKKDINDEITGSSVSIKRKIFDLNMVKK